MTWLAGIFLEVINCNISVLESNGHHVGVAGVDVDAHDPVGCPALVLRVRGVLQRVDAHHPTPIIVLKLV